MKKWYISLSVGLAILTGCNQADSEEAEAEDYEVIDLDNVEIPDLVFESDKEDEVISEDEMKESLTTYLDTFGELSNIQFELMTRMDEESGKDERHLMKQLNQQLLKNDDHFAHYIERNTLPEGYDEETERAHSYVNNFNISMIEIDVSDELSALFNTPDNVNGREQAKIEAFLEEKGIETTAFKP